MSTTFGIVIPTKENEEPIEIAHRHGIGNGKVAIDWLNPLAYLLPDDTPVIPLDNTAQGVYTIGDIKKKQTQ
jgi:hypothetical protein